ncbi:LOW QUALITY PROTEIN: hypothetical protein M513_12730 [Trichuris suis]|uniref:CCHC-type domain-containing protein n=1 Tax=Trichuris suis TaxID=68888 RepID=A0A085LN49_9BILA|nr:LOW QUALITY PROTEIN: hypothetical protein M513_12730 [Trichuris suis]
MEMYLMETSHAKGALRKLLCTRVPAYRTPAYCLRLRIACCPRGSDERWVNACRVHLTVATSMSDSQGRTMGQTATLQPPHFSCEHLSAWAVFEERLHFFFTAQGIADDQQKCAVLLTAVCEQTFDLLRTLVRPKALEDCKYAELVGSLYGPILARLQTRSSNGFVSIPRGGETISDFVTDLRRLSAKCNFLELYNMIRERQVCGLRDEALQCRLFAQKQLDLAMALSLVEAYKAARKDVECIRTRQPDEIPIDRMQITRSPAPQRPGNGVFAGHLNCSRCTDTGHDSRQCPFKNARGPSLLGRNWFAPLGISLVYHLREKDRKGHIAKMKSDFAEIFQEGLGKYKGPTVSLSVLPDVEPKFMKSRPVPFALRAKVDAEIRRLVKDGVLEPVADSKWATPLVCVLKRDGSVRVCANYRVTVNPAISNNVYPLSTLDEAFAALAGGKCFTWLDL